MPGFQQRHVKRALDLQQSVIWFRFFVAWHKHLRPERLFVLAGHRPVVDRRKNRRHRSGAHFPVRVELTRGMAPVFLRSQPQAVNAVRRKGYLVKPVVFYFPPASGVLAEFSAGDGTSSSFAFGNTFPNASVTAW